MNRVIFTVFFAVALASQAAERPNVVILYADDMGVADVSYGDPQGEDTNPEPGSFGLRGHDLHRRTQFLGNLHA